MSGNDLRKRLFGMGGGFKIILARVPVPDGTVDTSNTPVYSCHASFQQAPPPPS
jgi:hypothetical protein